MGQKPVEYADDERNIRHKPLDIEADLNISEIVVGHYNNGPRMLYVRGSKAARVARIAQDKPGCPRLHDRAPLRPNIPGYDDKRLTDLSQELNDPVTDVAESAHDKVVSQWCFRVHGLLFAGLGPNPLLTSARRSAILKAQQNSFESQGRCLHSGRLRGKSGANPAQSRCGNWIFDF